jgi:hypothetical protein
MRGGRATDVDIGHLSKPAQQPRIVHAQRLYEHGRRDETPHYCDPVRLQLRLGQERGAVAEQRHQGVDILRREPSAAVHPSAYGLCMTLHVRQARAAPPLGDKLLGEHRRLGPGIGHAAA